jgi:5'-nucleotidase
MRFPIYSALIAALGLASSSDALKILMGNDDGFGSGNLRELYKLLVDAGHDGTHLQGHLCAARY